MDPKINVKFHEPLVQSGSGAVSNVFNAHISAHRVQDHRKHGNDFVSAPA